MTNLPRYILLSVLLLLGVSAQATSFTVQAPRQVNQGNKFSVRFILRDAEGDNFIPPEVPATVKRVYGPAKSTSYSSSWVNGKTSSSSSIEFSMLYVASQTGKITIGSASIVVGGKRMSTKPITIEVLPADRVADPRGQNRQTPVPPSHRGGVQYDDPLSQDASKNVSANDLFVRIEMSKPRVYEQQAVVCTIKLYTKYQISQFIPTLQPSFDGFLIEEIPMQPSLNNVETHNGQQYMVAVLKRCLLYPQQSGKLTITSGNYDITAIQYENFRTPFGTLSQPVEKQLKVKSNTATVNILPLPEPQPEGFTGAVGKFTVKSALKPAELKTYSAATYSLYITGTGNIKYIKAPTVNFPKEMDVYDPKLDARVNPGGGDMSGTVQVDYTFIPQYAGEFEIPASKFTFFNPETGAYESVDIPAQRLNVAKGKGEPSNRYRLHNMDIADIHRKPMSLSARQDFLIDKAGYWLGWIVPLVAFIGLIVYFRKQLRERADVKRMRTKRANKVAQRRLRQARAFIAANNKSGFYNELLTALWGYLSDKLSIPTSELNKDNIDAQLTAYGVEESLRAQTLELLDRCEFAQYAPELAETNLQQVHDQAAALIGALENVKRSKPATS